MRLQPINLLGGYGKDDSTAWSPRDCVNYIPELAEDPGARSRLKLRGAPGLKVFASTGTGTRAIRGSRNVEGKFFVVSGTSLLQVATDGTTTTLGTIPGTRRCSLSHNQIPGGNELLVVNGNAGYTWNTVTEVFAQVTDEGYPGAIVADYIDTFLAQVEPFGRYWFHSGQAAAGDYNTLDRYESEASPDRIVTGAVNQLEFVAFNETTTEFFVNTGATNAPFTSKRIVLEHGCAGPFAVGRMDNSLLWYGNDGVFYRLNGYAAEPISTGAVEKAVADMDGANCFTTVYEDEHHKICYWTFPNGITVGYDAVTRLWHRRASYGLDRWRVNTLTKWNGLWIAGDMSNGRLYVLDWDYPLEDREPLVSDFTCPIIHNNQNNAIIDWLEFLFDTGGPDVVPNPYLPLTLSGAMPDAFVGDASSGAYTASGGIRPYTYAATSGTLPPGITLASDGTWSGTHEGNGNGDAFWDFAPEITVTDADGDTATFIDSVRVTNFSISGNLLDNYVGESDAGAYTNTHGFGAITYAVTAGTFPAGMVPAADGTWSGTFTTEASYAWTVTATDAAGNTATLADSATISIIQRFVAGTNDGLDTDGDTGFSITGIAWDQPVSAVIASYYCFGNDTLLRTVGADSYASANRGATWGPVVAIGDDPESRPCFIGSKFYAAVGGGVSMTAAGASWANVAPAVTTGSTTAIGGTMEAGGAEGLIVVGSNTGHVSHSVNSGVSFSNPSVAVAAGSITAVSDGGPVVVLGDQNGNLWWSDVPGVYNSTTSPFTDDVIRLHYDATAARYVGLTANGETGFSLDGKAWVLSTTTGLNGKDVDSVNGLFVMVANPSAGVRKIHTSTDCDVWVERAHLFADDTFACIAGMPVP